MEGAKGMSRERIGIIIVVLFHIVGLVGFFTPALQPLFLKIVPYHLLLMFLVIEFSHQKFDRKFIAFVLAIFILGFSAEWLGVHTHLIFGKYIYGKTLGLKLLDIPLLIGLNWFLLIYSTGVLMQHSGIKNLNMRVVLGALVLVLLDVLIEPIAVRFDYWHWLKLEVPFENYLGWFILSGLMLGIFEAFKFAKQNKVAMALLIAQFVFFALLRAL
jgi:putative membrane protein